MQHRMHVYMGVINISYALAFKSTLHKTVRLQMTRLFAFPTTFTYGHAHIACPLSRQVFHMYLVLFKYHCLP